MVLTGAGNFRRIKLKVDSPRNSLPILWKDCMPLRRLELSFQTRSPTYPFPHQHGILRWMNLNENDLQEFSRIWSEEFHEEISMKEARQYASSLLELYSVLARPLPGELQSKEKDQSSEKNEVLPLLPKIKRGRRPPGALHRIATPGDGTP